MNQDFIDILTKTKFITLSTTDAAGQPWGTPIGLFHFDGENLYFYNDVPGSVHLANLAGDPRIFITIVNYDQPKSRSLHIQTRVEQVTNQLEIKRVKELIGITQDQPFEIIYQAKLGEFDQEKTHGRHFYFKN